MNAKPFKNASGTSGHKMSLRPQIPVSPPYSMFTCFNKLPLELRSMIWKLAEPKRTLLLTPSHPWRHGGHVTHLSGHRRIINGVCTEARDETEKDYRRLTVVRRRSKPALTDTLPLFNPQIDTIYARDGGWNGLRYHFLDFLEKPNEGELVKKFAIKDHLLSFAITSRDKQRCITALMKLDELSIVVGETKLHPTRSRMLKLSPGEIFDKKTFGGSLEDWQGKSCVSGWWGRGLTAWREDRWRKVFNLMRLMEDAEKMDKDSEMPVIKAMVINKRDFQSGA